MMPLVDRQDRIIGYQHYSKLKAGDIWRISSIWATNSIGESLIARRHPSKTLSPNKWGPAAAGTVEKGESYLENAEKELQEEIGVSNVKLTPLDKVFYPDKEHGTYRWCMPYKLSLDWPIGKFTLQATEVSEVKWVNTQDLLKDVSKNPDRYVASAEWFKEIFQLSG